MTIRIPQPPHCQTGTISPTYGPWSLLPGIMSRIRFVTGIKFMTLAKP